MEAEALTDAKFDRNELTLTIEASEIRSAVIAVQRPATTSSRI